MSDMEEDEDYGFEYETDDDEEQDVDIENQVSILFLYPSEMRRVLHIVVRTQEVSLRHALTISHDLRFEFVKRS